MGAGDGKVIMLIGGSLGPGEGLNALFLGFLAAAVISVFRIIRERSLGIRLLRIKAMVFNVFDPAEFTEGPPEDLYSSKNSIPLAACLAAGTFIHIFFFHDII